MIISEGIGQGFEASCSHGCFGSGFDANFEAIGRGVSKQDAALALKQSLLFLKDIVESAIEECEKEGGAIDG